MATSKRAMPSVTGSSSARTSWAASAGNRADQRSASRSSTRTRWSAAAGGTSNRSVTHADPSRSITAPKLALPTIDRGVWTPGGGTDQAVMGSATVVARDSSWRARVVDDDASWAFTRSVAGGSSALARY